MTEIPLLFCEGYTDELFIKALMHHLNIKRKIPTCNLKGIGKYKITAVRKFEQIQKANPNVKFFAIAVYDTDIFGTYKQNPPIDWNRLADEFKRRKVRFYEIGVVKCIEDWILFDYSSVLSHLRLKKNTKRPKGRNGKDIMKKLYEKANRVYLSGLKAEELIAALDFSIIISHMEITPSGKALLDLLRSYQ